MVFYFLFFFFSSAIALDCLNKTKTFKLVDIRQREDHDREDLLCKQFQQLTFRVKSKR